LLALEQAFVRLVDYNILLPEEALQSHADQLIHPEEV